jgi:hypothetical protein
MFVDEEATTKMDAEAMRALLARADAERDSSLVELDATDLEPAPPPAESRVEAPPTVPAGVALVAGCAVAVTSLGLLGLWWT